MLGRAVCILGLLLLALPLAAAEEPPYKRLLNGDDASKATELEKRLGELDEAAKFAAAADVADELLALRTRLQGADHWQTINARWEGKLMRQLAALPEVARAELAASRRAHREVDGLKEQGKHAEAHAAMQKVVDAHRRHLGEDHPATGNAVFQLALVLTKLQKHAEAEPLYEKAWTLLRRHLGDEHPDTLTVRHDWAFQLNGRGQHAKAEAIYREMVGAVRRVHGDEHTDTAIFCTNLGVNLHAQGKYAEAERFVQEGLDIRLRVLGENSLPVATSFSNLGSCLTSQGRFTQATPHFEKALDIRRRLLGEDHPHTILSAGNLAMNLTDQGKVIEAEALLRQVVERNRRVLGEDQPNTPLSYNNLATNLHLQGRHGEAHPILLRALELFRRIHGEEHMRTAQGYNNVAVNLTSQGKVAEAQPYYEKSLALRRKLLGEEHPDTALAYANLAACHASQKDFAGALRLHQQALELRRRKLGEDHPHTASSYNHLGHALHALGNHRDAEPQFRRALEMRRKLLGEDHPETAATLHNLANTLTGLGRHTEARECYMAALDRRRRVLGEDHPETALTYGDLACCVNLQGDFVEAERWWREAARRHEQARLRRAFAGLDRAVSMANESPLPSLAGVLARNGKPEEAWRFLERHLSQGLLDDLSARRIRGLTAADRNRQQELIATLQRLTKALAALPPDKASAPQRQQERADLATRFEAAQAEFGQFETELASRFGPAAGAVYDLADIQSHLPPDAALFAWIDLRDLGENSAKSNEHWACLVRRTGQPIWVRLAGTGPDGAWTEADDELPARAAAACRKVTAQDSHVFAQLATQRLAPIEPHLGPSGQLPALKRLYVLPSRSMLPVPVEALLSVAQRPEVSKHAALWAQCTVSYAPSGTLYAWLRKQAAEPRDRPLRMLAVADPTFHAGGPATALRGLEFAPLPGTRREVEAIADLWRRHAAGATLDTFLGSDANEEALSRLLTGEKPAAFRFVHLATHGVSDRQRALQSFLLLAQDRLPDPVEQALKGRPVYDGKLTAEQILRTWNLDTELVVLSACETGLGKYGGGEGYLGFTQALFLAGARSVILSQWRVSDAATSLLMVRFYENWLGCDATGASRPRLGKAEALKEAKHWLRNLTRKEVEERIANLPEAARGLKLEAPAGTSPAVRNPDAAREEKPFAHPYYWSAFILIGDPE